METKKKGAIAVVTEGAAQAALRRGPAKSLAPDEEKVLRMRLGATPPRTAALERSGAGLTDLEIELLSYEIEAHMKWRAHLAERAAPVAAPARVPTTSRTKEKIVRALRRKA
jgi:hypothetical protein